MFALTWVRNESWAKRLRKPPGRAVSDYPCHDYITVAKWASHINTLNPEMQCEVRTLSK